MPTYTEQQIREKIYSYLLSVPKEITELHVQFALSSAKKAIYELLQHPKNWPKGDYLVVFWKRGRLEVFLIHKDGLKPLINRKPYDPLEKFLKENKANVR